MLHMLHTWPLRSKDHACPAQQDACAKEYDTSADDYGVSPLTFLGTLLGHAFGLLTPKARSSRRLLRDCAHKPLNSLRHPHLRISQVLRLFVRPLNSLRHPLRDAFCLVRAFVRRLNSLRHPLRDVSVLLPISRFMFTVSCFPFPVSCPFPGFPFPLSRFLLPG